MSLTITEIKEIIYSMNIRNYAKTNIFQLLLLEKFELNDIHDFKVYKYHSTYIINIKYGGKDILWSETQRHLDTKKTCSPKYKFILQQCKDIQEIKVSKKQSNECLDKLKAILSSYK